MNAIRSALVAGWVRSRVSWMSGLAAAAKGKTESNSGSRKWARRFMGPSKKVGFSDGKDISCAPAAASMRDGARRSATATGLRSTLPAGHDGSRETRIESPQTVPHDAAGIPESAHVLERVSIHEYEIRAPTRRHGSDLGRLLEKRRAPARRAPDRLVGRETGGHELVELVVERRARKRLVDAGIGARQDPSGPGVQRPDDESPVGEDRLPVRNRHSS